MATISSVEKVCQWPEMMHFVLETYMDLSLKEEECLHGLDMTPLDLIGIAADNPILQQLKKLGLNKHKQGLQLLVWDVKDTLILGV